MAELFRRQLAVDPLQHACVGVAHGGRDDLVGEGGDAHPAAVGAAQVVGRAALDASALARLEEIAAHVRPRKEEQVLAGRVVGGVAEQAQQCGMRDDEAAVARLPLGAAQVDPTGLRIDVLTQRARALAPVCGRRDHERDRSRFRRRQFGQEARELVRRERAVARPVAGAEALGQDLIEGSRPQPRPQRQAKRRAQRGQFLVDRVVARSFVAARAYVRINSRRIELRQAEVVAEQAQEHSALLRVELGGLGCALAGLRLGPAMLDEHFEDFAQRRPGSSSLARVGGLLLEAPQLDERRRAIGAVRVDLPAEPVLVDIAEPNASASRQATLLLRHVPSLIGASVAASRLESAARPSRLARPV